MRRIDIRKDRSSLETIVHRGSNEVGGNCVEVRTTNTRIIIDVGMPLFGENRQPHDLGKLKRLSADELRSNGILLKIPGLFELDRSTDETNTVAAIDAILLSHAHQDHTGLLPFTRPEIPVYGTSGTSKMMLAGSIFANQVSVPRERYHTLDKDGKLRIGDIEITPIAVDHSIYGSVAFLLEADGKRIIYSGDLRMHGRKPGMMKRFIELSQDVDELLLEGTHIGLPNGPIQSEFIVEDKLKASIQKGTGLVLISLSAQHLDRLVGLIRACKQSDRTLVLDFYSAFVLHLLSNEVRVPTIHSDPSMKLIVSKALERRLAKGKLASLREAWSKSEIQIEALRANPERYVTVFQNSMLKADFDGKLPDETRLIYSRWDGYLQQDSFVSLRDSVEQSGGVVDAIHTSGHIYDFDLAKTIAEVQPKSLKAMHTFEPELLIGLHSG